MILWQRQPPTIISLKSPSLLINNRFRRGSHLVGWVLVTTNYLQHTSGFPRLACHSSMVFPGPVCEVSCEGPVSVKCCIRTSRKTTREKTKLKKDWEVLVHKKWNTSELSIFGAIITSWTIFTEAQLLKQGMLLLLSTQVIHMGSSVLHTEYRVSRVSSKKSALDEKKEAKQWTYFIHLRTL